MTRNHGVQLRHPLPFDAIALGDLTLNPGIPANDVRSYPPTLPELSKHMNHIIDLQELRASEIGGNVTTQFQSFLLAKLQARHQHEGEVRVPLATKYLIRNNGDAFKAACGDPEIRSWLVEHCVDQGRPAAMIVGMYTYNDASFRDKNVAGLEIQASAVDPSGTNNLGAQAGGVASRLHRRTFTMPDEQIFAIEYRSLAWRTLRKKTIENARLAEKNRWEIFSGDRSKGAEDDAENQNMVEFELGDDELDELDDEVIYLGSEIAQE